MKTIAEFSIHYHQYLDENSQVVNDLPTFAQDNNHLVALYKDMLFLRELAFRMADIDQQAAPNAKRLSSAQAILANASGTTHTVQVTFGV